MPRLRVAYDNGLLLNLTGPLTMPDYMVTCGPYHMAQKIYYLYGPYYMAYLKGFFQLWTITYG